MKEGETGENDYDTMRFNKVRFFEENDFLELRPKAMPSVYSSVEWSAHFELGELPFPNGDRVPMQFWIPGELMFLQ